MSVIDGYVKPSILADPIVRIEDGGSPTHVLLHVVGEGCYSSTYSNDQVLGPIRFS